MSNVVLKDASLQAYYESLFAMYAGTGWKALMEDVEAMKVHGDTVSDVGTIEELWFRKGQLEIINRFGRHQEMTERAYAAAIEEQEGTEQEETLAPGVAKVVS